MTVYAVSNTTWSETAITWNNKPARGSVLSSTTVTGNSYYELDVSNYIISEKAAGRNLVSFALHNPQNSPQSIWLQSRETSTSSPPQLVLTLNDAPTVALTSPANGAAFTAPATVTLTATAADPDGTIQKVEFFHGGTNLIATVTSAPYTFNWSNVAAGAYTLTAKATDNLGGVTTSAPVNITVNTGVAQLYFIHTDHLDTPRIITNQAGQAVWRWDHAEPFGSNPPNENPSGLGTFTCNLRLPGQYFDKETNLHYNYFRDYDPGIGRYVESDPVGLIGGLNTYAYVANNPLKSTDPIGLAKSTGCPGGGNRILAWGCNQSWDDCYDKCIQDRIGDPRQVALNFIAGSGLFAVLSTPVTFAGVGTTSLGTLIGALAGRGYGSLVGGAQAVRTATYAGAVVGRGAVWIGGIALSAYGSYAFGSVLYCSGVCTSDTCYY